MAMTAHPITDAAVQYVQSDGSVHVDIRVARDLEDKLRAIGSWLETAGPTFYPVASDPKMPAQEERCEVCGCATTARYSLMACRDCFDTHLNRPHGKGG
jgi:hypothetical protein